MDKAASLVAAAEATQNPLIPAWGELIVGGGAFLVVLGIIGKMLVPRLAKTLEERTDAIEGGIKRAEQAQAEAQQTLEQYRAQLAEARHEAARLREEAREQGAQIKAELRTEGEAERQRLVAAAQTQIEADRQQAIAQLRAEIGSLSVQLAGRIVGEALADDARQRRVVDRFLAELEERTGAEEEEQVTR